MKCKKGCRVYLKMQRGQPDLNVGNPMRRDAYHKDNLHDPPHSVVPYATEYADRV